MFDLELVIQFQFLKPSLSEKDVSIFLVKRRYQVDTNRPSPNTHSANLVIWNNFNLPIIWTFVHLFSNERLHYKLACNQTKVFNKFSLFLLGFRMLGFRDSERWVLERRCKIIQNDTKWFMTSHYIYMMSVNQNK